MRDNPDSIKPVMAGADRAGQAPGDPDANSMLVVTDESGLVKWVNPAFEACTGYTLAELRGRKPGDVLQGPRTDPRTVARIREKLEREGCFEENLLNYTKGGTPYWVHIDCTAIKPESGLGSGYVGVLNNISDRKSSQRSLQIAASVFDHSHEAILITDRNNRILDANPAFSSITGYSRDEVLGLNPAILSSGRHSRGYYRSMWQAIEKEGQWRGEIWNRRKNGEEFAELLTINRVHLDEPDEFHHVAVFTDITELKTHAKELDRAVNYDDLTGLPNRQLLEDRLAVARSHAERQCKELSVCYLDLDGFKSVNDRLGEEAGNQILKTLAERLATTLRSGDTVARVGGDEFAILLQDDGRGPAYQRILATLAQPFSLDEQNTSRISITGSLGIARYPEDPADAEGLIRHADQAMYSAKEKGRNQFHIFDPSQDEHRRQRRKQLVEINRAMENNEFVLYFQPQVNLLNCDIIGFEALIRWNHPDKGLIPPGAFLPVVENSHLEVPLGQWVVKEAIYQLNQWRQAGQSLPVSVNISAQHLVDRSFGTFLRDYIHAHPELDPKLLALEVLESTALEDLRHASNALDKCRQLGLRIALDDFGTGFSSLTHLRTLPVDLIKIDKSFVLNMLEDADDRAIVESVIFLAQRFSHPVLAEGVETLAQAQELQQMGCTLVQGFGIARPMPAEEVLAWTDNWRRGCCDTRRTLEAATGCCDVMAVQASVPPSEKS